MPPVAPHVALSNFAVTYRPPFPYVADEMFPVIPVPRSSFEYYKTSLDLATLDVDTLVSETGKANEIQDKGAWVAGRVIREALRTTVTQERIDEYAGLGYDPREGGVARLRDYMDRRREVRSAALGFATGSFGAQTGAASTKWDSADGKPLTDIVNAQAACLYQANSILFGRDAWSVFCTNPNVIKAVNPTGGEALSPQAVRSWLAAYGFTNVSIGAAIKNSAKKGQTVSVTGIWGDSVAVYYKNPAMTPDGVTFGASFCVELGGRGVPIRVDTWFDQDVGTRGGEWIKASREIVETIVEPKCGYLITDVKS